MSNQSYDNLFQILETGGYPVYSSNNIYNFTEKDIQNIYSEKRKKSTGNLRSNNTYILNEKKYLNIRKFVEFNIETYIREILKVSIDNKVYVTQSWLNYSKQKMKHHKHSHPNSFISGIMYIQFNENCPTAFFRKDSMFSIVPKFTEWNSYNSGMQYLYQKTGGLLLFPSTLEHMVPPFEENSLDTRITLSFNTYIKGKLNMLNDNLTHLNL